MREKILPVSDSDLPTHPHFVDDTQILQGSLAHLRRIISHPHLAKRRSFPLIQSATPRGSHLFICRLLKRLWPWSSFLIGKSVFDHLIIPFWGSWSLDFQESKVKLHCTFLMPWSAPQKASGHLHLLTYSVFAILAHSKVGNSGVWNRQSTYQPYLE